MSALLRLIQPCKTHVFTSVRARWNSPLLTNNVICRQVPSPSQIVRGTPCLSLSTGARSRVNTRQHNKKGKTKSKKNLLEAHKELVNVLETQQKLMKNTATHIASADVSTSNTSSLNHHESPSSAENDFPNTSPGTKNPLLSSPFFDNDTFGEDPLLNSPLYQKHMKLVEEGQRRVNKKKTRKMKVLGTKMKTKALPEATTVNNSDIQITDTLGNTINDISQSNVYYLDSSIPEEQKKLVNEIGKIMPTGLSEQLKTELSALVARLQAKEESQSETSQVRNTNLKMMVKRLARKAKIVPFWKPEELKNMDEVLVASRLVRFLNSELSRETSKHQHLANEKVRREAAYNHEVKSYVEACIQADMVKTAHSYLVGQHLSNQHHTRQRNKSAHVSRLNMDKQVTDPEIYDLLVGAWAKQGDLASVRQLFQLMQSQGVQPSLTAYVHCLHCLGRSQANVSHITQRVIWDLRRAGYVLEDALNSCALHQGEWQYVLKAIHSVLPDFIANPPTPPEPYNCVLLNNLNDLGSREPSSTTNPEECDKSTNGRDSSVSFDSQNLLPVENPNHGVFDSDVLCERAQLQLKLEEEGFVNVPSIAANGKVGKTTRIFRERLADLKEKWRNVIHKSLQQDLQERKAAMKGMKSSSVYPYLKLLPVDKLVDYVMQEVDELAMEMQRHSPSVSLLQLILGFKIQRHCLVLHRRKTGYTDKMLKVYQDYLADYNSTHLDGRNHRQLWQEAANKHHDGTSLDGKFVGWPRHVASQVGKLLYTIILMDLKIPVNLLKHQPGSEEFPAFYTLNQKNELNQDVMVIRPHPDLAKLFEESQITDMKFNSSDMPSLVPPPPWCSLHTGGTFLATVGLVKHKAQCMQQLERLPDVQLYPVLDALNSVSAVPWIINKPVLDLVIKLFNRGGDPKLDIPLPASALPVPPELTSKMTPEERIQCFKKRRHINKERKETHSLWMTELYRLSIANKYRDEVFWFPHNLDFRGRSYAIPPHFNHLGADLARSILVFAKGRLLGPDGFKWLKIHLVNLTGMKKRSSNADRLAFAEEMMPEIFDSADKPFTGNKWWQTSDEPWQTLACCMEIAAAARSEDPATFVSHFPVHQDGSCNGLQHYAALGRDQAGAESVNLHPFHEPKDVYSDVVELVEEERIQDAAAGMEVAKALDGFIRRKVIKQTIMTTVYGVTPYGARQQIRGQLKNIEDFPQDHIPEASKYLSEKTFKCLEKMFTRTKEIQDWLTISAELVSTISNQPVAWETPLGFPVMQPYFQQQREVFGTHANGKPAMLNFEKPNVRKQCNGFPPNYIHSLDATHMMLTAIYCLLEGITFVSVHDCFWTHAADVPKMNQVCREQFVALHNQPILEGLAVGMLDKFGFTKGNPECRIDPITQDFMNHVLSTVPKRGSFELNKVLESTYFFS